MTDRDFTYWLQGFAELNDAPPTTTQWAAIREHLQLVFEKRTPPINAPQLGPPGLGRYGQCGSPNPGAQSTC